MEEVFTNLTKIYKLLYRFYIEEHKSKDDVKV